MRPSRVVDVLRQMKDRRATTMMRSPADNRGHYMADIVALTEAINVMCRFRHHQDWRAQLDAAFPRLEDEE